MSWRELLGATEPPLTQKPHNTHNAPRPLILRIVRILR